MASFGENLRRERELRGVGLREIAEATKISVRFLQALENDRVDQLPGGLFPRAFVRQYARYLGLDAERTVAEYLYLAGAPASEMAPPAKRAPRTAFPRGAVFFAAVVVVGVALSLRMAGNPNPSRSQPSPAVPEPKPRPAALETPAAETPALPPVATTVASPDGLVLTLTAQQDCWVQAQADGENVLNRVLAGGETTTLEAHGQIVLSVGNAGGLVFRVNDRPGVPLGKSGEVKRNIVINRDNLPSLVQQQDTSSARASSS
jgi:cytoskeletal protein RodZ